ncbi:hypothetical protein K435DRAFT_644436, partial [Dendrothele bispora CBS 962.96]
RVRNVYLRCGHAINEPEVEIKCENYRCKFSPFHSRTCVPPNCLRTCQQYHQYPEMYSPQLDRFCPACMAAGRR